MNSDPNSACATLKQNVLKAIKKHSEDSYRAVWENRESVDNALVEHKKMLDMAIAMFLVA